MVAALGLPWLLVGLDSLGVLHGLRSYEESILRSIDLSSLLMQGMLSFLLFAGALHVDLRELRVYRWQVGALAVIGTLMSTVVVGRVRLWTLPWVGLPVPLLHCMLFGAALGGY